MAEVTARPDELCRSKAECERVYRSFMQGEANLEALYDCLVRLADVSEQVRLEQPQNAPDVLFLGRYDIHETTAAVTYSIGRTVEAFDYAERARARLLLDRALNKLSLDPKRLSDSTLLEKEAAIRRQVQELSRRWASMALQSEVTRDLGALSILTATEDELKSAQAETALRRARDELKKVQDAIREQDPAFAALRGVVPATADDARALLDDESALLTYCVTEERVIIFILTSQGLWSEHSNVTRIQLAELVMRYRNHIEHFAGQSRDILLDTSSVPAQPGTLPRHSELDSLSHDLYNILIQPAERHLRGRSRLGIVPHGDLHLLPFQALRSDRGYLIESFELWYAPSVSLLDLCHRRHRRSHGRLLAMGDPDLGNPRLGLPFAAQEVNDIALLFGTTPYVGADAKIGALKAEWEHSDILHLACHAVFDEKQPEFSALLLTPGADDAGRLEVNELLSLDRDLPLSQVTLSACQTSLGVGSDLTGLATGFLYAGASAVLASLWRVDDYSTSELMLGFYGELVKGGRRSAALREGQLRLLRSPEHAHPFFWAAFNLIGAPFAMESEKTHLTSAFNIMHRWAYRSEDGSLSAPAISGGMLYATWSEMTLDSASPFEKGLRKRAVVGISLADRQLRWKREVPAWGEPFCWRPGLVHVNATSLVLALSATDGEVMWERESGARLTQSVYYDGSRIYLGGRSRSVYALHPDTGEVVWEYQLPRPASGGFCLGGDIVFVGCNDHNLYALRSSDGKLLWKHDLGYGEWESGISWVSGSHLHTTIGTFALATGERNSEDRLNENEKVIDRDHLLLDKVNYIPRNRDIGFRENFVHRDDDFVFVISSHTGPRVFLNVFDAGSGNLLRRYHLGEGGVTGICREGDLVVIGSHDGVLHGFSLEKSLK